MIGFLKKRNHQTHFGEVLLEFVHSWDLSLNDEVSICASVLDLFRKHMGERPCCIFKNSNQGFEKVCERGVVESAFGDLDNQMFEAVTQAPLSDFSKTKFEPVDPQMGFEGYLHVPIKINEDILGMLAFGVFKEESQDQNFIQPIESIARIIAIALKQASEREVNHNREGRLRAEVEATTRELESTNQRLIERVKELKALHKELQNRVEELTKANRAKNEFLSIVSHELRTPLTSLSGFLAVLLDEDAGSINEQQRKFLAIAKQSAGRLNLIISDLLDVSRIESGRLNLELIECPVYDILGRSVEGLKSSALSKNINLHLHPTTAKIPVWGDASRLQQVVDNLISNAIKFTSFQGKIDVFLEEKGDLIQVSVKDTGPGLSIDEQEKVFDMFYQADTSTRRPAGGAGLGLAIARGIIEMHGGKIFVQSEKGLGSTFYFVLPRKKMKKAA